MIWLAVLFAMVSIEVICIICCYFVIHPQQSQIILGIEFSADSSLSQEKSISQYFYLQTNGQE